MDSCVALVLDAIVEQGSRIRHDQDQSLARNAPLAGSACAERDESVSL
jgi:hypothetical protein